MESFSQEEIVKGVRQNDSRILNHLYRKLAPQVKAYIFQNGGSEQDAEDILQDGIIAFYTNVNNGSYTLQPGAKVTTYINQICRFRWLENRKSARSRTSVQMEESH